MTSESSDKNDSITASSTDMAVIRTALALDRTLLAWVRTSLTLVGFGFTLAKFVHELVSKNLMHNVPPSYPRLIGFALMILGLVALIGGAFEYISLSKKLHNAKVRWSVSLWISVILIALSILLLTSLLSEMAVY